MAKHNSALGLFVGNEGSAGFCFVSCFVLFHLQTVLCILMFVVLVTDFCFLFVSFSFLYLFYFPHSVLSSPVSIAPPPPPMPQLTPQIPLTGFVARVQENSKFGKPELSKSRGCLLIACMADESSFSLLFLRS